MPLCASLNVCSEPLSNAWFERRATNNLQDIKTSDLARSNRIDGLAPRAATGVTIHKYTAKKETKSLWRKKHYVQAVWFWWSIAFSIILPLETHEMSLHLNILTYYFGTEEHNNDPCSALLKRDSGSPRLCAKIGDVIPRWLIRDKPNFFFTRSSFCHATSSHCGDSIFSGAWESNEQAQL